MDKNGYVYFITDGDFNDADYLKIGYSKNKPDKKRGHHRNTRLMELQVGNPKKLYLICSIKCKKEFEKYYHWFFDKYLCRNEWFNWKEIKIFLSAYMNTHNMVGLLEADEWTLFEQYIVDTNELTHDNCIKVIKEIQKDTDFGEMAKKYTPFATRLKIENIDKLKEITKHTGDTKQKVINDLIEKAFNKIGR